MEISNNKNHPINIDAYVNQVNNKTNSRSVSEQSAKPAVRTDTVEISDTAKKIQEAKSQLENIPDIREEKVANIKSQIESGKYEINPDKIASSMIRDALLNELA